jgi:hypothetical protein
MMRSALRSTHRTDGDLLRLLVVAAGLLWSIVFVILALQYRLQLYADGAMFSYAVAVRDVWAFHWHNISARLSVFLLSLWPAETFVWLTGSARGGIVVYGFLFYIAPLAGLVGTFAADRSRGRTIFAYACCSTALLCPLVFGFPTEMWMAHALFWPCLTLCLYARRGFVGTALVAITMAALVFTHEGALVLAFAIVLALALRGTRDPFFRRTLAVLVGVLGLWVAVKIIYPPDRYFGEVLIRAGLHFFDPTIFEANLVVLLLAILALYGFVFLVFSQFASGRTVQYGSVAAVVVALLVYWLWFDHWVHASNRYYLRTLLVVITPMFGLIAAFYAQRADGSISVPPALTNAATLMTSAVAARAIIGAFLLVNLVHVVQTSKFVTEWTAYKSAVRSLATGSISDPALGDPRFVSAQRIAPDLKQLTWFSTVEYLSVLVSDFMPTRLVIDPRGNYFWLSCRTATANFDATRAVPAAARDLIRIYSCLHR